MTDFEGEDERPVMDERDYTLVFCRRGDDVLLGMKKRGFGMGKWNGFGGKLEAGETIEEAAKRELEEESGLIANSLERLGYLVFHMEESRKIMKVHIYNCTDFSGTEVETEEMNPQWFNREAIPYELMWPDDPMWLPMAMDGKKFIGRFEFSDDDTIEDYSLREQ
jgi:8-oxo-dGTP diphosphatase / 2-hydroxy-dATP diphosphatase